MESTWQYHLVIPLGNTDSDECKSFNMQCWLFSSRIQTLLLRFPYKPGFRSTPSLLGGMKLCILYNNFMLFLCCPVPAINIATFSGEVSKEGLRFDTTPVRIYYIFIFDTTPLRIYYIFIFKRFYNIFLS